MVAPLEIRVREIPHCQQAYDTCGDWRTVGDTWQIHVSNLGKWQYAFLIAIHEQIEMALCKQFGVDEKAVTAFDIAFEAARVNGNTDEPGDDPQAPYREYHQFATIIEQMVAEALKVQWDDYDKAVTAL